MSCLSSQRRRVAEVQVQPNHALVLGLGLCSPRCVCPTTSHPLTCTWKRKQKLFPRAAGGVGVGVGGETRERGKCLVTKKKKASRLVLIHCLSRIWTRPLCKQSQILSSCTHVSYYAHKHQVDTRYIYQGIQGEHTYTAHTRFIARNIHTYIPACIHAYSLSLCLSLCMCFSPPRESCLMWSYPIPFCSLFLESELFINWQYVYMLVSNPQSGFYMTLKTIRPESYWKLLNRPK